MLKTKTYCLLFLTYSERRSFFGTEKKHGKKRDTDFIVFCFEMKFCSSHSTNPLTICHHTIGTERGREESPRGGDCRVVGAGASRDSKATTLRVLQGQSGVGQSHTRAHREGATRPPTTAFVERDLPQLGSREKRCI